MLVLLKMRGTIVEQNCAMSVITKALPCGSHMNEACCSLALSERRWCSRTGKMFCLVVSMMMVAQSLQDTCDKSRWDGMRFLDNKEMCSVPK